MSIALNVRFRTSINRDCYTSYTIHLFIVSLCDFSKSSQCSNKLLRVHFRVHDRNRAMNPEERLGHGVSLSGEIEFVSHHLPVYPRPHLAHPYPYFISTASEPRLTRRSNPFSDIKVRKINFHAAINIKNRLFGKN